MVTSSKDIQSISGSRSIFSFLTDNYLVNSINGLLNSFSESKKRMSLTSPGPFENLHREARTVSLTNLIFEGGKLELAKVLSNNFQLSHTLNLEPGNIPSTYRFGSVYIGNKGMIDNNGDLNGKYNYSITPNLIAKATFQVSQKPGYSMLQLESDYIGDDYSANIKAVNMDPSNSTGIYAASYLQSITKNLAIGIEGVFQRPDPDIEEAGLTYVAKYAKDNYIFTLNLQNMMALQASYYHKVNESIELCSELQTILIGPHKEALATVGLKMDFKRASLRAQVDSMARIALYLEENLFGRINLLVSGEIDHLKGRNKFGVGIGMEL